LHARQAGTWGCMQASCCWNTRVRLHACTRTHAVGTQWTPAFLHSLVFRASWSLGVCAGAPLCTHVCTWPQAHTPAVRPAPSHSLACKGWLPLRSIHCGRQFTCLEKCVTLRAPIFSVARNATLPLTCPLAIAAKCGLNKLGGALRATLKIGEARARGVTHKESYPLPAKL